MEMLSRRMKHQYICSESWPPAPDVKYTARERQASTYLLDVCPSLLQLHRDFLSLFISMTKKAEALLTGHCRFATDVPAFQVSVFVVVQS
jgi:hypothetical protein